MATRKILMPVYILQLTGVLLSTQGEYNDRLVELPEHPTPCKQGDCVELSWSYKLRQGDEVSKVTFGTWVDRRGYVEQILVRVKPNDVYTRPNYKSRLSWTGNFSRRASVRLCNVTKEDETYYGVEIDIRGKTSLKDGTELYVNSLDTTLRPKEWGEKSRKRSSFGLFIPLTATFAVLCFVIVATVTLYIVCSRRKARSAVPYDRFDSTTTL